MKGVVLLLWATVCCVSGGALVWPGAIPLPASFRSIIPPQVKGFAYSTSQYINAVQPSYSFGYQPQVGYQIPQLGVYPTYPGINFQPVLAPPYYAGTNPLYPGLSPIRPPISVAPSPPPQSVSAPPPSQEAAGDEDTAIVDSAEFPSDQRGQIQPDPSQGFQTPFNTGSYDSKNMPAFPQIQSPETPQPPPIPQPPQIPGVPEIPQPPPIPQGPQTPNIPQIPQIPQYPGSGSGIFQFPQFSQPQLFQPNPSYPQAPSQSQPSESQFSFPSPATGTQGLSDEDTIAVDSA
ncbi:unnamed protein product [Pieris brassicae]|uniref:Uncharacterized protein n=2 Tax=Pieris brassicae TaxID=7116 RepID=A0A9P0TMG7_PIEBR|nr:unnamed protein product [Pieris brassicae]